MDTRTNDRILELHGLHIVIPLASIVVITQPLDTHRRSPHLSQRRTSVPFSLPLSLPSMERDPARFPPSPFCRVESPTPLPPCLPRTLFASPRHQTTACLVLMNSFCSCSAFFLSNRVAGRDTAALLCTYTWFCFVMTYLMTYLYSVSWADVDER